MANRSSASTVVQSRLPSTEIAKKIIGDLKSYTWPTQNPAINALRSFERRLSEADEGVLEELGRNVYQAAVGNAWRAVEYLETLRSEPGRVPEAFCRGILLEGFVNEAGEFRFKGHQECHKQLRAALTMVTNLDQAAAQRVTERLVEDIKSATPKEEHSAFRQKEIGADEWLAKECEDLGDETVKELLLRVARSIGDYLQRFPIEEEGDLI